MKKIIILFLFVFFSIFIIQNCNIPEYLYSKYLKLDDCDYWSNKSSTEILDQFSDKSDYYQYYSAQKLSDCHIKEATPFIITLFRLRQFPHNPYGLLKIGTTNNIGYSPQTYTNRILFHLWNEDPKLTFNNDLNSYMTEQKKYDFKGNDTINFWQTYYSTHK